MLVPVDVHLLANLAGVVLVAPDVVADEKVFFVVDRLGVAHLSQ